MGSCKSCVPNCNDLLHMKKPEKPDYSRLKIVGIKLEFQSSLLLTSENKRREEMDEIQVT